MKNKIYSIIMLALIVGFTSCKKDDETGTSNTVTVNAINYLLSKGAYVAFGDVNFYGSTPTHHSYEFFTTDGNFVIDAVGDLDDITGKVAVYVDLYSAGAGSFKSGTYTFVSDENDGSLTDAQLKTKYENKNVCSYGFVITGPNSTTSLGTDGVALEVKSGTVSVEGTKPNYKLTYDLVLTNNQTVKGSYSGNFTLITD